VKKQIPLWIRHAQYNLRGGFLVRPLTMALALGAAGAVFSWAEETFPIVSEWVPRALFPSHTDPQVAQIILGAIAASIMTVVSIVFAILLMTLTLASMQFSPRIIVSFARDRVTQWTLGIFLGTFSYCIAALPAARSLPQPFSPVATVVGAMVLALMCVAWLLFFIHHISQAISVSHIVDRIASETDAMIDEVMPEPRRDYRVEPLAAVSVEPWEDPLVCEKSGYIRYVDIAKLVAVAKSNRVKVHMVRRVGQFVPAGAPLVMVYKGARLTREATAELREAIDIGPARTLQQDVEFGILQIVDIALKAISPAVNDPTTGITCVDQLSRILIRVASREPPDSFFYDPPGVVRVSLTWPTFSQLVHTAFDQIRLYAHRDTAVSLRLLRALNDIASVTRNRELRHELWVRARGIVEGCSKGLSEEDVRPMRARLAALEKIAECAEPAAVETLPMTGDEQKQAKHHHGD
jgi:uncharacterized membrane protein